MMRGDFSAQAHMPQACEAKRAGAKKTPAKRIEGKK
jgi:hypothetical protein